MDSENNIGTETKTNTEPNSGAEENKIEMTEEELNAKIQSETDKVRTKYSKENKKLENKVKELESKVKELTPVEKSEAEIDLDNRLKAIEAKERKLSLAEKGISSDISEYLKEDIDIDSFSECLKSVIDNEVNKRVQNDGYKPGNHKSGEEITKEDFDKMNYAERAKLFNDNPELYAHFSG